MKELIYLVIVNLLGFGLMGADKRFARAHTRRVPENVLFVTALLGGSLGSWIGMYVFRHKTRHWYFVIGMPLLLALQVLLGCYICCFR